MRFNLLGYQLEYLKFIDARAKILKTHTSSKPQIKTAFPVATKLLAGFIR